jgi:hypothetical protein
MKGLLIALPVAALCWLALYGLIVAVLLIVR